METSLFNCAWPHSTRAIFKDGYAEDTWDRLWRRMIWCYTALYYGVHLAWDEWGDEWPEGSFEASIAGTWLTPEHHRFVVWNLEADRKHNQTEYGMNARNTVFDLSNISINKQYQF